MTKASTLPSCGLSVAVVNEQPVIFLTVPEAAAEGDTVNIWTNRRSLLRLQREIKRALSAI